MILGAKELILLGLSIIEGNGHLTFAILIDQLTDLSK